MIGTWVASVLSLLLSNAVAPGGNATWKVYSIESSSMTPALRDGERIVVDTRVRRSPLRRGEIVVFALPSNPRISYVKRVVAVGGDMVEMKQGQIVLNGQAVPRLDGGEQTDMRSGKPLPRRVVETLPGAPSYATLTNQGWMYDTVAPTVVPEGFFYVLGDNRDNSIDSRMLDKVGFVPLGNLEGRDPHFLRWRAGVGLLPPVR